MEHFKFCAEIAAQSHAVALKPTEFELITRFTMDEFICYTKGMPLTLEEYKKLIIAITGIVSPFHLCYKNQY